MTIPEFLARLATPPYRHPNIRWGVPQSRELSGPLMQPHVVAVSPVQGVYLVDRRLTQATTLEDMGIALGLSLEDIALIDAAARKLPGFDTELRANMLAAVGIMDRP